MTFIPGGIQGDITTLLPGTILLDGYVATDGYGDVVNATPPTVDDVFGNPLSLPPGVSVSHISSGHYQIVLSTAYPKLLHIGLGLISRSSPAGILYVSAFNNTSATVAGVSAQTIDLQYEVSGSAHVLVGGFTFVILLKGIR